MQGLAGFYADIARRHNLDLSADTLDAEQLQGLLPTPDLAARQQRIAADLADYAARGEAPSPRLVKLKALADQELERAALRDQRRAETGCDCLGLGGWDAIAAARFEDVPVSDAELAAFPPRDVPNPHVRRIGIPVRDAAGELVMAYRRWCGCAVGQAKRAAVAEQVAAAELAASRAAEQARLDAIWRDAGVSKRLATASFESYPVTARTRGALAQVRTWLASPPWALTITGTYGVGKTGLAVAVMRQAAEAGMSTLIATVPDLLATWKATFEPGSEATTSALVATLKTVDLLVLDDMGVGDATEWQRMSLWTVLDARYGNERKTIVTSNLDRNKLGAYLGERTNARFLEGAMVTLDGPNLRLGKAVG